MTGSNWVDNFRTGHDDIDSDRRNLFALINGYHAEAAVIVANETTMAGTIDFLTARVHRHLADVMRVLETQNSPHQDRHAENHRDLEKRILGFRVAFQADPQIFDFPEFMEFLGSWLQANILSTHLALMSLADREAA